MRDYTGPERRGRWYRRVFFYKNSITLIVLLVVALVCYTVYQGFARQDAADDRADQALEQSRAAIEALQGQQGISEEALAAAERAAADASKNGELLRQLLAESQRQNDEIQRQAIIIAALTQQLRDEGLEPLRSRPSAGSGSRDDQTTREERRRPRPQSSPSPSSRPRPSQRPSPRPSPSPTGSPVCVDQPPLPRICTGGER